ncbi:MAG TPA: DUF305 domain-containing protein [Nocardioidaceae bacterium]|nr:DUF305 domain-containing protein [Nocardioidaceae bacterium]
MTAPRTGRSRRALLIARLVTPLVIGLAVTSLAVSACTPSGGAEPGALASPSSSPGVTVIQPGKPGEPNATVDPDDLPSPATWSHSDVAFMQMMIPHHAQALEMSRLASSRAEDPQVLALARRIKAAQGPEIMTMAAWLEQRGIEVPRAGDDPGTYDHSSHGHDPMSGMLSEAEMEQLAAARGGRFDTLFLRGMIGHHSGAVQMADRVAVDGTDQQVSEIAADVQATQTAEIDRMRQLLSAGSRS